MPDLIRKNKKKIKEFDTKLKTSFILIRQDLDDMQIIVDAMKKHLNKKDREYQRQNKYILKAQQKIQEDIDQFDQKIIQLNLALSQISAIKQEIVIRKDLYKIEDRIKNSFRNEVDKYKAETVVLKEQLKESNKRIDSLEKGIVREPKKSWFKK